ncbi:MAG: hypothetical protein BGP01_08720 [Paludibacter sp. 47-17]|nr:MAG: hypothetical protein BGP01_08720 [Paludibacter sp. 47-17]
MNSPIILKSNYSAPVVERIVIDADIALSLNSLPPEGPGEGDEFPFFSSNFPPGNEPNSL